MRKVLCLSLLALTAFLNGCYVYTAQNGRTTRGIMLQVGVILEVSNECVSNVRLTRPGRGMIGEIEYDADPKTFILESVPFSGNSRQIDIRFQGYTKTDKGLALVGSSIQSFYVDTYNGTYTKAITIGGSGQNSIHLYDTNGRDACRG